MTPLCIGACLKAKKIEAHHSWLFESGRYVKFKDSLPHAALTSEFEDRVAAAQATLNGHIGRIGVHGPFECRDIDNKNAALQPLMTASIFWGRCRQPSGYARRRW